ncbi:MAG: beta galactosidase jelly roll domain-containing protein [Acidobacteria bacterium]|nr:beta galactosidase jelly roll domain-containing protein [Acidobacteriota bacterium]
MTTSSAAALMAAPAWTVPSPQTGHFTSTSTETRPLAGPWLFKLDRDNRGGAGGWHRSETAVEDWTPVTVPHTWQIEADCSEYQGVAWYRTNFESPEGWAGQSVRVEFEAVYHSAKVWLNDRLVGEHLRSGYTAFTLSLSAALRPGGQNTLVVRLDNSFDDAMLPRGDSFDWTVDGGIIRPVQLLISPPAFIERIDVDARPIPESSRAEVGVSLLVRNDSADPAKLDVFYEIYEDDSGRAVWRLGEPLRVSLAPQTAEYVSPPATSLANPRLWHFDQPHLYRLEGRIERGGKTVHRAAATFGIRKLEVKNGGFYLNGERVWLMGVERMAGSNPQYGMAEPESWIHHDHDDMKELNAVFTRVHWQQDRRVLDYCDRHGILVQVEIPAWGTNTFKGMGAEPSAEIMQNGLDQLQEMISRDRNHPCVFAWGLCNEVDGQNPPAQEFIRRLVREAKKLDPHRLLTYASNSLHKTPQRDVAGEMDFIMWNEYYESWLGGGVEDVGQTLEAIHGAFPDKTIVISEYGFCECRPDFSGGDARRIKVLREHTNAYRRFDYVGGAIFFSYNDYRTHIGDKGTGALRQRVHGVVDLYGARKPSFDALREESSPVERLSVSPEGAKLAATVITRQRLPAYILEGYTLRWTAYANGDLPMEQHEIRLPPLSPGQQATVFLPYAEKNPERVRVDIVRPTGFSTLTAEWKPTGETS